MPATCASVRRMVIECRSCVIVFATVSADVAIGQLGDDQLVGTLGEELSDTGHQLLPCGRTQPAPVPLVAG